MGDFSPPETTEEKVETLRAMARDRSFRLSINERAAIAYALRMLKKIKTER
jgi:hypothetical protein